MDSIVNGLNRVLQEKSVKRNQIRRDEFWSRNSWRIKQKLKKESASQMSKQWQMLIAAGTICTGKGSTSTEGGIDFAPHFACSKKDALPPLSVCLNGVAHHFINGSGNTLNDSLQFLKRVGS